MQNTAIEPELRRKRTRYASAATLVSMLLILDLVADLLCIRVPLLLYLIAGAIGFGLGGPLATWVHGRRWFWRVVRWGAIGVMGLGLLCAGALTANYPASNSKCGWRSCGRVLGPGLLVSPFPAPPITCQLLSVCANEYPHSRAGYQELLKIIKNQGCPPP
ncbi:MAG: hypothetical protein CMH53_03565 [Myxococcales bacterium]|nr:hypothetical protein [Myxococcales bacterium]